MNINWKKSAIIVIDSLTVHLRCLYKNTHNNKF